MSLNMYLGEVQGQTQSMNAVCNATIQGMEQVIQSIDAFAIDTVLQGQTYSSAKSFFVQTFRPLAQGIIYLCEELIRQNDAFPSQFQSQVASTDVIEQEILEQIREIDRMKASMEAISQAMLIPGMDAMANLFTVMRKKLQEKLDHLYQFNQTSSNNYSTALQLAASIAAGLAEVQSGKGFSPASGTFSTQGLNMEWTTSIQAITEERARQAANSIEEGEMCGKLPEKSTGEKIWDGIVDGTGQAVSDTIDGIKALGDWETWENMGNAALHPIDTLSTMYNVLSDSFIDDVINGDAESRAKWGSYALTQVGLGLIGDKGLSKVSKVATTANLAKGMSRVTNSATYRNTLNVFHNYTGKFGNDFAFAGGTQQYLQKAVTYTYEGANGPKTIKLRKGDLAGDKHPVTGVPYDIEGFPIFEAKGEVTLKEADFKKSRPTHDRICSKALYEQIVKDPKLASKFTEEEIELFKHGEVPDAFTWHHHQDTGRMQLVDYELHRKTGHTGGYKIWGKDSDK
ncbi:HNH endonuclease [Bacillus cereus]|uniref:HNH endonuclease n=1 Tax=Bacillus cereus TaxID=1396 RepID=UPI000BF6822B|nr:HNH endonuclease [Bacillus cereus]PEQ67291.1 cytoplasmic protein [Bacillus cereus]PFK48066.1 cytoplasmic protein [Bacillus cereus]PFT90592.1 cytoplasmic protein [Bacillus cereus]PGO98590.1 cytoplasmic protein [Bacillus cereus]QKH07759.1 HNH endonuclease [Bacillus cereus]